MFFSRRAKSDLFNHLTKSLTASEAEVQQLTLLLVQTQAELDKYVRAVAELTRGDVI